MKDFHGVHCLNNLQDEAMVRGIDGVIISAPHVESVNADIVHPGGTNWFLRLSNDPLSYLYDSLEDGRDWVAVPSAEPIYRFMASFTDVRMHSEGSSGVFLATILFIDIGGCTQHPCCNTVTVV
jgi:hypothetical protein